MSQLTITDLNFFEAVFSEKICPSGGIGNITPNISTALSTDLQTNIVTGYSLTGNLTNGFGVNLLAGSGASSAAAAAASVGGNSQTFSKA